VYVEKSRLNSFLSVAKDLQIKGLVDSDKSKKQESTENNFDRYTKASFSQEYQEKANPRRLERSRNEPITNSLTKGLFSDIGKEPQSLETRVSKAKMIMKQFQASDQSKPILNTSRRASERDPEDIWSKDDVKPSLDEINNDSKNNNDDPDFLIPKSRNLRTTRSRNTYFDEKDKEEQETFKEEAKEKTNDATKITSEENKKSVNDFLVDIRSETKDGHRRTMAKCSICSKDGRKDHLQLHIKSYHPEYLNESGLDESTSQKPNNPKKRKRPTYNFDASEFIEDPAGRITTESGQRRRYVVCKICSTEVRSDRMKAHVAINHSEALANRGIREDSVDNSETGSIIMDQSDDHDFTQSDWDLIN